MPQTRECDYCGAEIEPGTGTMFVRTDGTTIHYCSAKCEKNADLGREARDLSWTEAGSETAGEAVEEEPATEPDPTDDGSAVAEDDAGDEDETDEQADEDSEPEEVEQ
ncbi:50S ribosomal protein L24e [Halorhabdus sp. CBA1104]|uniref:50S ribosomal protein L24e n=1 Tax=unclassified Halorhabdus TaxID=2621901 RepID=UPI0012B197AD|nr:MULTISPECIES: 50S ribosomal protein L24e [unclassified Halorhabdus]QGN06592.1 50S ribosomal protein L24e [Halorhabdus sp. CBA1104]